MIEWRHLTSKRMVTPAKDIGFFQRKNVGGLLDEAEQLCRSRGIGAYVADFAGSKKSTKLAGMDGLSRIGDCARYLLRLIVPCPHHPQCDPFRGARTDSRHLSQLRNQGSDCDRIFCPSQCALSFLPTATLLTPGRAARAGANRIAMQGRRRPRGRVLSEIRNRLPPNVFPDKEPRRSRKNLFVRHALVWLLRQARVAHKFRFDHANSFHLQNQSDAQRLSRSRYRR